jgi:GNAT acetyltransferase-like protein
MYSDFDVLPVEYERLFANANSGSFFYSLPWFRNFIKNGIDQTDELRLYCIEDDRFRRVPVGILPMRLCGQRSGWGTPIILRGLANYYSPVFGPILDKSYPNLGSVVKRLIRAVCVESSHWDAVDLNPLSTEASNLWELSTAFKEAGCIVQRYFCFGNWFLQVDGRSYKTYFDALPSALKNTITRKRKKLMAGRLRLEIITGGKDLGEGLKAYQNIYAASWKNPEPYGDFMPGLIRACAEHGTLRLGLAYVDGHPAAAQVWIVDHSIASIYKLAYQEQFSQYSVGSILTAHMMEYVIDADRVHEVDYLVGDDAYKKSWMSHRRERWGVRAFNPRTIRGIVGISRHLGGRALKNSWRKFVDLSKQISSRTLSESQSD